MDPQELQKNIALYYSKLSPKLQETFSSMQWLEVLKQISTKYSLNEEQMQTIGTETTLLLLGMIRLEEYEEILKNDLVLPKDSLEKILTEINSQVINVIRPELVEAFETNIKPETREEQEKEGELDERFAKLPPETQSAIREMNYHATLYKIAVEHNLTVSQMADLETITTGVMLGTIKAEKFEESVKNELELPGNEDTKKLVEEITEKILKKIREKLEEAYGRPEEKLNNEIKEKKPAMEPPVESREDILRKIEKPETLPVPEKLELPGKEEARPVRSGEGPQPVPASDGIHPALAQKFAGISQTPVVETQHSLENLTKNPEIPVKPVSAYPKNDDPYRLPPE